MVKPKAGRKIPINLGRGWPQPGPSPATTLGVWGDQDDSGAQRNTAIPALRAHFHRISLPTLSVEAVTHPLQRHLSYGVTKRSERRYRPALGRPYSPVVRESLRCAEIILPCVTRTYDFSGEAYIVISPLWNYLTQIF
jgi:hypothetical protein